MSCTGTPKRPTGGPGAFRRFLVLRTRPHGIPSLEPPGRRAAMGFDPAVLRRLSPRAAARAQN
ncbi:hypothetical protein [Streptomyces sp. fd1-xmd]|uniref:hypothetical protein n=1 Tax=Streptomyces sp. fd1-xmd TaxID=1812480 RepID=UPI001352104D|nr:hypothetical protein [Streptomyces sp. fd1-xmd]